MITSFSGNSGLAPHCACCIVIIQGAAHSRTKLTPEVPLNESPAMALQVRRLERLTFHNLWCDPTRNQPVITVDEESVPPIRSRRKSSSLADIYSIKQKLVAINACELVDSFFTISVDSFVLYVSEILPMSNNPEFSPIQWPTLPFTIANESVVQICLYTRPNEGNWQYLTRMVLDLSLLIPLGTSLPPEDAFVVNGAALKAHGRWWTAQEFLRNDVLIGSGLPARDPVSLYLFDTIRTLNNLSKSLHELQNRNLILSREISRQLNDEPIPPFTMAQLEATAEVVASKATSVSQEIANLKQKISVTEAKVSQLTCLDLMASLRSRDLPNDTPESMREFIADSVQPQTTEEIAVRAAAIGEMIPITILPTLTVAGLAFPPTPKAILNVCYYNYPLDTLLESDTVGSTHPKQHQTALHSDRVAQINAGLTLIAMTARALAAVTGISLTYPIKSPAPGRPLYFIQNPIKSSYHALEYDDAKTESEPKRDHTQLRNADFETALLLLAKNLDTLAKGVAILYNDAGVVDSIPPHSRDNYLWVLNYLVDYMA